jgi:hypothetical protein
VVHRLADLDGNGALHDAGEQAVFGEYADLPGSPASTSGECVLGLDRLLFLTETSATYEPSNFIIVSLEDLDGDGDALDEGERRVWYAGVLEDEYAVGADLVCDEHGDAFLRIGDPNDGELALYRLADDNQDGDADDPGELTLVADGSVFDTWTLDHVVAPDGTHWFYGPETEAIYRLEEDALVRAIDDEALEAVGLGLSQWGMAMEPDGTLVFSTLSSVREGNVVRVDDVLLAMRDDDGDGIIDPEMEAEVRWTTEDSVLIPHGSPRVMPDGSIVTLSSGSMGRFADGDGDGLYRTLGEGWSIFDKDVAAENGFHDDLNPYRAITTR